MTDCPHCRRFREERDEALEALRQVNALNAAQLDMERVRRCAFLFKLQPIPARLLVHLTCARPLGREYLAKVSGSKSSIAVNAVDVRLSSVRAALRPYGIVLRNRHSLGWSIDAGDCARIIAMLDAEAQP
ncbi:MAG TPA: hypothetical protein PKY87_08880 [Terricaulis sp.]|nr:hypothetical protein [Terricaulis sp.]